MQHIKRKIPVFVLVGFVVSLVMIGRIIWFDKQDDIEKSRLEKLLTEAPRNLNINAARHITKNIKNKERYSFAVIGDSRDNPDKLKEILNQALKHNPDFIIHTGDFVTSGKCRQYMDVVETASSFQTPMIFVPGNHDVSNRGVQCYAHFFGPLNFYFDVGRNRFIIINNNEKDISSVLVNISDEFHYDDSCEYEAGIDEIKIQHLEKLLKKGLHSFVVMHMPPDICQFTYHSFIRNSDLFVNLMKQHAADIALVLCGHIHGYAQCEYEGVQYVVTGGAGAHLNKGRKDVVARYNYVLVNVNGEKVTHKAFFVQ